MVQEYLLSLQPFNGVRDRGKWRGWESESTTWVDDVADLADRSSGGMQAKDAGGREG